MTAVMYSWGRNHYAVDAQTVGETIQRINDAEGRVEPVKLVEAARDKASPLHALFTWNNKTAADKWRTHEARQVINSMVVTVKVNDEEVQVPAFISVGHVIATQDAGEGYRPVSVVAADEMFAQEAMQEALMRLRALRRRYSAIESLSPLWKALDQLEAA